MNIDLSKIEGKNDRRNIILLLNKKDKKMDDQSAIAILTTVYPDFKNYHIDELTRDLQARGFIEYVDMHPKMPITDEEGNENDKYRWATTPDGVRALDVEFFPSEYKAKNFKAKIKEKEVENLDLYNKELKRNRFISWAALMISIISIIIAAVSL